jgi:hypothetical protein
MNEERKVQGQVGRVRFWWSGNFADEVKVTKSDGKGLGWVADKMFNG